MDDNGASLVKKRWELLYQARRSFCQEWFGGRADVIFAQAELIRLNTHLGPFQSLDICMQVEAEFPGRVQEIVEKAIEHPSGILSGMMSIITMERIRA